MSAIAHHRIRPAAAARSALGLRMLVAAGLAALAAGLATLAALGPLLLDVVDYRVTETLRNQTIGLDVVSLAVVAPVALVAAVLTARGRAAGPALALGIGAYVTYMQLQYVLGPDYLGLAGNNERIFPLCVALFALGWLVTLGAWTELVRHTLPFTRRRDRLLGRVVLPLLAAAAFVRYVPELAGIMAGSGSDGYRAGPSFFWAIALLDLGVFLPLTVLTCVGLVRGATWARRALLAVAGWFAFVGAAVAAMAIAMVANGDPTASTGNAVFMVALGAAFAALALSLTWPLLSGREGAPR